MVHVVHVPEDLQTHVRITVSYVVCTALIPTPIPRYLIYAPQASFGDHVRAYLRSGAKDVYVRRRYIRVSPSEMRLLSWCMK